MDPLKEKQYRRAIVADLLQDAQTHGDVGHADDLRRELVRLHADVTKLQEEENAFVTRVMASGGGKPVGHRGPGA